MLFEEKFDQRITEVQLPTAAQPRVRVTLHCPTESLRRSVLERFTRRAQIENAGLLPRLGVGERASAVVLEFDFPGQNDFREALSVEEVMQTYRAGLSALAALHAHDLCHGDVRPDYVHYNRATGKAMLIDRLSPFGPLQAQCHRMANAERLYLSPRLFNALCRKDQRVGHVAPRSDYFSLALIFFEKVSGRSALRLYDRSAGLFDGDELRWMIRAAIETIADSRLGAFIVHLSECALGVKEEAICSAQEALTRFDAVAPLIAASRPVAPGPIAAHLLAGTAKDASVGAVTRSAEAEQPSFGLQFQPEALEIHGSEPTDTSRAELRALVDGEADLQRDDSSSEEEAHRDWASLGEMLPPASTERLTASASLRFAVDSHRFSFAPTLMAAIDVAGSGAAQPNAGVASRYTRDPEAYSLTAKAAIAAITQPKIDLTALGEELASPPSMDGTRAEGCDSDLRPIEDAFYPPGDNDICIPLLNGGPFCGREHPQSQMIGHADRQPRSIHPSVATTALGPAPAQGQSKPQSLDGYLPSSYAASNFGCSTELREESGCRAERVDLLTCAKGSLRDSPSASDSLASPPADLNPFSPRPDTRMLSRFCPATAQQPAAKCLRFITDTDPSPAKTIEQRVRRRLPANDLSDTKSISYDLMAPTPQKLPAQRQISNDLSILRQEAWRPGRPRDVQGIALPILYQPARDEIYLRASDLPKQSTHFRQSEQSTQSGLKMSEENQLHAPLDGNSSLRSANLRSSTPVRDSEHPPLCSPSHAHQTGAERYSPQHDLRLLLQNSPASASPQASRGFSPSAKADKFRAVIFQDCIFGSLTHTISVHRPAPAPPVFSFSPAAAALRLCGPLSHRV